MHINFKYDQSTINKVMVAGHNSLDIFTKIEVVKNLIESVAGEITNKELQSALCHCWYYKFGRRKELSDKEHIILDILLKHKLSPKTVYHWFLLNNAPESVKSKLKERKIGLRNAISASYNLRTMRTKRGSEKLMEDMRIVIRGLTWKSHEK